MLNFYQQILETKTSNQKLLAILIDGKVTMESILVVCKKNKIASADYISNHKGLPIGNGILFYMLHLVPIIGWMVAPFYALIAAHLNTQQVKDNQ
mgnify:CR=1 FL=1